MLFFKTVRDYVKQENKNYNYLMDKRKERFVRLVEFKAPLFIIKREIILLSQSFSSYIARSLKQIIGRRLNKISKYLL